MEIFNIGIPELVFIFLIMLIFMGPEGFSQTARGLARLIRKLIHSPIWNDMVKAQRDIQDLPTRLVREAGIEEIQQEVSRLNQETQNELKSIRQSIPVTQVETILPPVEKKPVEPDAEAEAFDYRAAALRQAEPDQPQADPPNQPGEETA